MLLLLIFTMVEDLLTGLVHGYAIADTMAEMMARSPARSLMQWVAPNLFMLLVLIPLIAFEQIDISMGKGSLSRILPGRSQR
jgi:hypothetical protein